MSNMSFSNFAQMLYPYYGDGKSIPEFVIELIENIVDSETAENISDTYGDDSLEQWYRGKPISKGKASKILSCLNKSRFEKYINARSLSIDSQGELCKDLFELRKKKMKIDLLEKVCTNIFVNILKDCASGKNRKGAASDTKTTT